jgi:phage-related protein (TIGR01555 family)
VNRSLRSYKTDQEMAQDLEQVCTQGRRELEGAREDAYYNALTGAGTSSDKSAATIWNSATSFHLDDVTLASMFTHDGMAARIVDIYPRTAFQGGMWLSGLGKKAQDVTRYLAQYECTARATEAWIWSRLFGGSVMWFLTDQDPLMPLTPGSYDKVTGIRVVDKRWLGRHQNDRSGKTVVYSVRPPTTRGQVTTPLGLVHESRLVIWPGARTEMLAKCSYLDGWDFSVLQRPYNALKNDGTVWGGIQTLIQEASVNILKVQGLFSLIGSGKKDAALERYSIINKVKGVYRAIVLDKDKEEFSREAAPFAGLADLDDRSIKRVAAEAEVPVTILMGEAPAGLNATGASDLEWFEGRVIADRTQEAEPRCRRMYEILLGARSAPKLPAGYEIQISFGPIRQPTAKEKAEAYSVTAAADAAYITNQVILPEEVFLARAGEDGWQMSDLDFDEEAINLRREALKNGAADQIADRAAKEEEAAQADREAKAKALPPGKEGAPPTKKKERTDEDELAKRVAELKAAKQAFILAERAAKSAQKEHPQASLALEARAERRRLGKAISRLAASVRDLEADTKDPLEAQKYTAPLKVEISTRKAERAAHLPEASKVATLPPEVRACFRELARVRKELDAARFALEAWDFEQAAKQFGA